MLKAYSSLRWRIEHDTPLFHYIAFLMNEHDAVPYADIFVISMPGTFALHYLIVFFFGYGDLAFRFTDLFILLILLSMTSKFMLRFGVFPSLLSSITFGLLYMSYGQTMSLQKDYTGIIFITASLLLIPNRNEIPGKLRFFLIGILYGISMMIKPHLIITYPLFLSVLLIFYKTEEKQKAVNYIKYISISITGFLMPLLITYFYLAKNNAFIPFITMFFRYLPLHTSMTGSHEVLSASGHIFYLADQTIRFGGYGVLLLCGIFGAYCFLEKRKTSLSAKVSFAIISLSFISYSIYPTIAGKFWNYHYIPFIYFATLLSSLCLYNSYMFFSKKYNLDLRQLIAPLAFFLAIFIQINIPAFTRVLYRDLRNCSEIHAPKDGRVDEIAHWIMKRLDPAEDTIQILDWTGGAAHALLISKAPLATSFLYDYHFYHHISHPFIKEIKARFISEIKKTKPRFIIDIQSNKPWVSGIDTSRSFPELECILENQYYIAFYGDGYLIYERLIL